MVWQYTENTTLTAIVAALGAAAFYLLARRMAGGWRSFSLLDGAAMIGLMAIAGAVVPWQKASAEKARQQTLIQNLYALRSQIALYKQNHGGEPPVLYQGTLPQMLQRTDAAGYSGPAGKNAGQNAAANDSESHFGPYFLGSLPPNPISGTSIITATDDFPPVAASGNRGWLYYQPTGDIAIDLPGMLNQ